MPMLDFAPEKRQGDIWSCYHNSSTQYGHATITVPLNMVM